MIGVSLAARSSCSPHWAGKRRMLKIERGGVFRSDWNRALFVHYEVDPAALAASTPFDLDLHQDRAFVSLVAFFMRRFRVRRSGPIGSLMLAALTRHSLLNARTYVRHAGEPGIHFLAEWINNPLSVLLGPRFFGLPYRLARLRFRHDHDRSRFEGSAQSVNTRHELRYSVTLDDARWQRAQAGSLEEFLLERYTAFTAVNGGPGLFRIWHRPWLYKPVEVQIRCASLLHALGPWWAGARLAAANYSPGVNNVWIGRPRKLPV